jgi:hypothetical protein
MGCVAGVAVEVGSAAPAGLSLGLGAVVARSVVFGGVASLAVWVAEGFGVAPAIGFGAVSVGGFGTAPTVDFRPASVVGSGVASAGEFSAAPVVVGLGVASVVGFGTAPEVGLGAASEVGFGAAPAVGLAVAASWAVSAAGRPLVFGPIASGVATPWPGFCTAADPGCGAVGVAVPVGSGVAFVVCEPLRGSGAPPDGRGVVVSVCATGFGAVAAGRASVTVPPPGCGRLGEVIPAGTDGAAAGLGAVPGGGSGALTRLPPGDAEFPGVGGAGRCGTAGRSGLLGRAGAGTVGRDGTGRVGAGAVAEEGDSFGSLSSDVGTAPLRGGSCVALVVDEGTVGAAGFAVVGDPAGSGFTVADDAAAAGWDAADDVAAFPAAGDGSDFPGAGEGTAAGFTGEPIESCFATAGAATADGFDPADGFAAAGDTDEPVDFAPAGDTGTAGGTVTAGDVPDSGEVDGPGLPPDVTASGFAGPLGPGTTGDAAGAGFAGPEDAVDVGTEEAAAGPAPGADAGFGTAAAGPPLVAGLPLAGGTTAVGEDFAVPAAGFSAEAEAEAGWAAVGTDAPPRRLREESARVRPVAAHPPAPPVFGGAGGVGAAPLLPGEVTVAPPMPAEAPVTPPLPGEVAVTPPLPAEAAVAGDVAAEAADAVESADVVGAVAGFSPGPAFSAAGLDGLARARASAACTSVSRARAAAVCATQAPTAVASKTGVSTAGVGRRAARSAVLPNNDCPLGDPGFPSDAEDAPPGFTELASEGFAEVEAGAGAGAGEGASAAGAAATEGEAGAAGAGEAGDRLPIRPSGSPGAGVDAAPDAEGFPPADAAAGEAVPTEASVSDDPTTDDGRVSVATEPAAPSGAGGQLRDGGRYDASARVRGRFPAAWRPPPVRLTGSGAPMALTRSGTWLGSTTYTISRLRPGQARVIRPAITARVPRMSSAQVMVLSQRGRTSAVACSCRPGWAAGFMMTRL